MTTKKSKNTEKSPKPDRTRDRIKAGSSAETTPNKTPEQRPKQAPKPEPIITPEDRSAEAPVNWFDKLHAMQREKDYSAVLKQGGMPVDQVRLIINTIFNWIATFIGINGSPLCETMLNDLFKAQIIQPGPEWDYSTAVSMLTKYLRQVQTHIANQANEKTVYDLISFGHGVFGQARGTSSNPAYVLYRYYRYLRCNRDLVLHAPSGAEGRELWKEAWRLAGQEGCVKEKLEKLEKSSNELKDFKRETQKSARRAFLDEIKLLKSKTESEKKG